MSLVEKCWMVTSKISVIALLMITGIYFGKFVCPYIKKKKGAVAVSIVYITIMLVLYMIPPQIDNFSAYLIGVIAAFLAMYIEDRRNIYQKIFLAITFFSIRWLTVAMAARLDDLVTKALVFRNMSAEKVWLQYGLYVGTRVLDIVLCIAFIAVAIGLINKAYIYKKDEMSVKEMVMFQNWKEMQEEQRGQELVLNQISDMKKHIEEVEKLYRDIRSMRHDMGNHIQTLEHLVAHNNMDDATEYLEHLKNEWDEVSPEIKTGSPVIDVILMEKLREAKERQIRFLSDFHYPQNTKLNAFDLSVIMNNALNNCMENVSGDDPYISISSFRKNSIFMITIKNSFGGQLNFGDSDLPETTKSGREHGMGLNNIRRVARMYMGDISLEQGNEEVILSIMMQVE